MHTCTYTHPKSKILSSCNGLDIKTNTQVILSTYGIQILTIMVDIYFDTSHSKKRTTKLSQAGISKRWECHFDIDSLHAQDENIFSYT